MASTDPERAYLSLADELFHHRCSEDVLPNITVTLPPLDEALLDRLAQQAEDTAQTEPRRGWAIVKIADAFAISQDCDLFVRAKAAWYLSRAANHWAQPRRVTEAIARARQGFEALGETGWLAACDWQENALAWTKPDFIQAARILEEAVEGLVSTGFDNFVPHCRLALAYAQILIRKFGEAQENILASEAIFSSQGDTINLARCWWTEASLLRRQSHFDQAIERLEKANSVFESKELVLDVAKIQYQFALIHLLRTDDLSKAISYFERSEQIFTELDLDLWQAACTTYLGSIYIQNGNFAKANDCYQRARKSFTYHNVLGLLANNLNDNGKLNTLRGFHHLSIEQFEKAEELYNKLGSESSMVAKFNQGEACGQLGRYQDALGHLERASELLEISKNYLRIGTCDWFIAITWLRLGQFTLAHQYLDKAIVNYEKAGQRAYFSTVYNYRAGVFFAQGELAKAIDCLENSLEIGNRYGVRPQAALAKRLLGEALLRTGQQKQAKEVLEQALLDFTETGMVLEQAATFISLGYYYLEMSESVKAQNAFQDALRLSQDNFPEIDWRAYAGLAEIERTREELQESLRAYRQGMKALAKIRHNFWQPALAGSYLQTSADFFDKAVSVAAQVDQPSDALQFIETSKAATLLQQLSTNFPAGHQSSQELNDLSGEIAWLQAQLRASFDKTNPVQSALRTRQTRASLGEKVRAYDALIARLERQAHLGSGDSRPLHHFDLASFREFASQSLGDAWAALDYYLAENQLITVVVSPNACLSYISPISARIRMALDQSRKADQVPVSLTLGDLETLGDWLIPAWLDAHFTPETVLLLAPHRGLHGIPWAALQPGFASQPLVCLCIPALIPSLQSLAILWRRRSTYTNPSLESGLIMGLSEFPDAREALPSVRYEIAALRARLRSGSHFLLGNDATWENLHSLKDQDTSQSLSRFPWMHFATHAFADARTGRLGGFALWDGDIHLDRLRDLAPLPDLVTFSACNGMYSFIYEGDEHVGLSATCLMAGANRVVGCAWPIIDVNAAEFIAAFYGHYLDGVSPARAVAQTQRQMLGCGETLAAWAGFTCLGAP